MGKEFWTGLKSICLDELNISNANNLRFIAQSHICNQGYLLKYIDFRATPYFGNIVPLLKNFSQLEWFGQQSATWNSYYQPEFTEVLTPRGYGFAFNMLDPSKMFHNT